MIYISTLLFLISSLVWATDSKKCSLYLVNDDSLAAIGNVVQMADGGKLEVNIKRDDGSHYVLTLVPVKTDAQNSVPKKVDISIDESVVAKAGPEELHTEVAEIDAAGVHFLITPSKRENFKQGKLKTWMIEAAVVAAILSTVAHVSGGGKEWIGTLAVLLSFMQFQVSNRLEEKEGARELPEVECFKWNTRYFISKEFLWVSYFLLSQTYTALAGAGIFITYPMWRKLYRRYYPLER